MTRPSRLHFIDTEGGRGLGTKEAMIDALLVVYAGAVSL